MLRLISLSLLLVFIGCGGSSSSNNNGDNSNKNNNTNTNTENTKKENTPEKKPIQKNVILIKGQIFEVDEDVYNPKSYKKLNYGYAYYLNHTNNAQYFIAHPTSTDSSLQNLYKYSDNSVTTAHENITKQVFLTDAKSVYIFDKTHNAHFVYNGTNSLKIKDNNDNALTSYDDFIHNDYKRENIQILGKVYISDGFGNTKQILSSGSNAQIITNTNTLPINDDVYSFRANNIDFIVRRGIPYKVISNNYEEFEASILKGYASQKHNLSYYEQNSKIYSINFENNTYVKKETTILPSDIPSDTSHIIELKNEVFFWDKNGSDLFAKLGDSSFSKRIDKIVMLNNKLLVHEKDNSENNFFIDSFTTPVANNLDTFYVYNDYIYLVKDNGTTYDLYIYKEGSSILITTGIPKSG